jgi:hypothetical protein
VWVKGTGWKRERMGRVLRMEEEYHFDEKSGRNLSGNPKSAACYNP